MVAIDGINWEELKVGPGQIIKTGDRIRVLHEVVLLDEISDDRILETNFNPDKEIEVIYSADNLLEGVFLGMAGMRAGGGSRLIRIGSKYAYGNRNYRNVHKNSDLSVRISVIEVVNS